MFGGGFGFGGGGFGGGGFFGGGGMSDEEYQQYLAARRREAEARLAKMRAEQKAIDDAPDAATKQALNRQRYKCGDNFITLKDLDELGSQWTSYAQRLKAKAAADAANPQPAQPQGGYGGGGGGFFMRRQTLSFEKGDKQARYAVDDALNAKLALWRGDITRLEIDAVVNAANGGLLGGGGIDGAIHGAAGELLYEYNKTLPVVSDGDRCEVGDTKISPGFALPAKWVLSTVGPIERGDRQMRSCYRTCFDLCIKHGIRSVALCGVGTGIFGFDLRRSCHIALDETRKFLESLRNGTYISKEDEQLLKKQAKANAVDAEDSQDKAEQEPQQEQQAAQPQSKAVAAAAAAVDGAAAAAVAAKKQPGLDAIDRIIICNFTAEELECYETIVPSYFPIEGFRAEKYVAGEDHDDFNRDDARPRWTPGMGGMGGMGGMTGMGAMGGVNWR